MKIDFFLAKQIKNHILYLVALLLVFLLFLFSLNYFLEEKKTLEQKKESILKEIANLERKKNTVLTAKNIQNKNLTLEELNKALNTLIPESEDYFSILFALEKISQETGFQITGYQINLKKSNAKKIAMIISGFGDRNSFMDFIKNYRFIGNRLITIDSISFTESGVNDTKIGVNFYNSPEKKELASTYQINTKDEELLKEILEKTNITSSEEPITIEYETKDNPF
jgi:Tfp pilus assembly protein PilO